MKHEFDPTDIFAALNAERVKYLVVGGIAVALYGVGRMTWDVDLAVQLTTPNVKRLIKALERIGFERRVPADAEGLADPKTRRVWMKQKGMKVYSFVEKRSPPRIVDIMVEPLRNFDQLYRRKTIVRSRGVSIPLMPIKALVSLKKSSGRPQDLQDIRDLKLLGAA